MLNYISYGFLDGLLRSHMGFLVQSVYSSNGAENRRQFWK